MLAWVGPTMWAAVRTLAFILQLGGLVGLMGFSFIGLMNIMNKILEEASAGNEDQA